MTAADVSITAEVGESRDGRLQIHLKIGLPHFEINLCMDPEETSKLALVSARPWIDGTIVIGTCLGASAHWSSDDGTMSVLVGHDDQTWDVGVDFPVDLLSELRLEVERCRDEMKRSGASA